MVDHFFFVSSYKKKSSPKIEGPRFGAEARKHVLIYPPEILAFPDELKVDIFDAPSSG